MTLRGELLEAAVSAAKAYGHERAEPRHVHLAIARRFRARPEVEPLLEAARRALEPRGLATTTPTPDAASLALLDGIESEPDAVRILRQALASEAPDRTNATAAPDGKVSQESTPTPAPVADRKPETTAAILAELDALVGLKPVKEQVRRAIAVVQANAERRKAGLATVNPSLHLVFTGPPGTGKTTVARLVARLYAAAGALRGAGFTEATRADLIAGYVGQTAIKTAEVIAKTRPGVLFIDEAYALTPTSAVDFGAEAIATLVKAMEDHRDDLAVIVAGYGHEMTTFVDSNPGLRSRFKTFVAFPDYAPDELVQIFATMAQKAQVDLAEGVTAKVHHAFDQAVERAAFGNARFARSLFEQAYARMAARAAEDGTVSVSELLTLTPDDIVLEDEGLRREERRMGFDG